MLGDQYLFFVVHALRANFELEEQKRHMGTKISERKSGDGELEASGGGSRGGNVR